MVDKSLSADVDVDVVPMFGEVVGGLGGWSWVGLGVWARVAARVSRSDHVFVCGLFSFELNGNRPPVRSKRINT